jgi:hypothetical protein
MSTTATLVPFFTDQLAIVPQDASDPVLLGRPVRLTEFACGRPVALYELSNGELRAEIVDSPRTHPQLRPFIQGPPEEASPRI